MAGEPKYEAWSQEQLIARIQELERQIGSRDNATTTIPSQSIPTSSTSSPAPFQDLQSKSTPYRKPPKAPPKPFDISKYSTRLIALKFAYLGQKYNGFEHHKNNSTPLPTVEEELWKALVKTRCINPIPTKEDATDYSRKEGRTLTGWDREGADVNWDGCEYSKCGRTDRGVSAFGQVIGVRVRSNLPKQPIGKEMSEEDGQEDASLGSEPGTPVNSFNDLTDELPYIQLLNRVLPPDIRVYAWCPNPPPNFSARFSCKERRYKYFFTNPCFAPVPGSTGIYNPLSSTPGQETMREGWLDISAMKQACKSLIGLHDFRNLCKIDASKQLTNFQRRIFYADIEEVSPLAVPEFLSHSAASSGMHEQQPKTYAFVLHGSAFLWHQVRSIMALLFLIGQRLEPRSLIDQLLDISANPTRPKYEMASDAPLVLWDCIFPDAHEVQSAEDRQHGYTDRLQWVYVGDEGGVEPKSKGTAKAGGPSSAGRGKWGRAGVIDDVWEVWRRNKIDETLSALLLDKIAGHGRATLDSEEFESEEGGAGIARGGPRVFDGGDVGKAKGKYVQVLDRERGESVEV
ncbi:pseudouridylate synthase 3 [Ampelomyces quisqualis]|uniref:Pseudouridylate synthase 3 n=1 Tax=Ampelomyces quisqualis TaxID=50730 RepID=A0A6A5QQQ2_AMPQU|nr:pseudouridylate synthase 3 [Ampelomyces quisqualis]